jgi:hypothetical protein
MESYAHNFSTNIFPILEPASVVSLHQIKVCDGTTTQGAA